MSAKGNRTNVCTTISMGRHAKGSMRRRLPRRQGRLCDESPSIATAFLVSAGSKILVEMDPISMGG